METLTRPKGWVFAQIYGLYNIGVCDQEFLLERSKDFDGIALLPKDESIALEQGNRIKVWARDRSLVTVQPLLAYSKYTLAPMTQGELGLCDFMTLNAVDNGRGRRYASFIAALGIYKFVGCKVSFFVPIWATPAHAVANVAEYDMMRHTFASIGLSTAKGVLGSITPWIPLIPIAATSTSKTNMAHCNEIE
jgi:hypothetical protein